MIKYIIVGLGNPDEEYQNTRHNLGFMMLDFIAKKNDFDDFEEDKKINALISKGKIEKNQVLLVKPLSYVNKSGDVVGKIKKVLKAKPAQFLVIHDDLDIDFGNTKLTFNKSAGGHRGVDSIIKSLKTEEFYRLKIGTASSKLRKARQQSDKKRDELVRDFVLSKFSPKEHDDLRDLFKEGYTKILQLL
jgi:PTH1 family peptidyl-tRNA hydrolase